MNPSPRAPQQERSRQTAVRITAAALELLATESFEEMTVSDIARRAGISVGGFYARFPSKDALLDYFQVDVFEGLLETARERLDDGRMAGRGAREVIETYISMAVDAFRRHRRVLQQVSLRSRTTGDEAFRERVRSANRFLHGRLRSLLREREGEIGHPDPELAIDIGLTFVSGAMREYVLFDEFRPNFPSVDDIRLVAELSDSYCAYLRLR